MNKNTYTFIIIIFYLVPCIYAKDIAKFSTWSFHFENITIIDALKTIEEKTGLSISIHQDFFDSQVANELFSKTYTNKRVDQVLTDLFRTKRCGIVWNYRNDHLENVKICIFNKSEYQEKPFEQSSCNAKPTYRNRNKTMLKKDKNTFHNVEDEQAIDNKNPAIALVNNQRLKQYDPPPMPPIFYKKKIKVYNKATQFNQPDRTKKMNASIDSINKTQNNNGRNISLNSYPVSESSFQEKNIKKTIEEKEQKIDIFNQYAPPPMPTYESPPMPKGFDQ